MAKRFFDHHPPVHRALRATQGLHHRAEQARRDGEVVRWPLRIAKSPAQSGERVGIGVVTVHIVESFRQPSERRLVDTAAVFVDAGTCALEQLVTCPARFGHPNHGHLERSAACHAVQGGEDLLIGQVARGAEEDERVRAFHS